MKKYLLLLLLVKIACTKQVPPTFASLGTPWGLAVANGQLFVANYGEDSVHVLTITEDLQNLSFIQGDTKYYALRIPAGPLPTDLAATPDGAYVVVLSQSPAQLQVIETKTLTLLRNNNERVVLSLGGSETGASSLIGSPSSNRFYVALSHLGQIVEVEFIDKQLKLLRTFDVGGVPTQLALHPNGQFLYATMADAPEVIQIPLTSGNQITSYDLEVEGTALAVSSNGKALLVARPFYQDILIFSGADTALLTEINSNTLDMPDFECLQNCTNLEVCSKAHPSETSLCSHSTGYNAIATYNGFFVERAVAQMLPLGKTQNYPELQVACLDTNNQTQYKNFSEYVTLVGFDGVIQWLGLQQTGSENLVPEMISSAHCRVASVDKIVKTENKEAIELDVAEFLDACVTAPTDLQRTRCLKDTSGQAGVVVFGRGQGTYTLQWEGIIFDGSSTGVHVLADGNAQVAQATGAQINDKLEILTPPLNKEGCATELCNYERTIVGITENTLQLDTPLNASCFREGVSLSYRIRAANVFMITSPTNRKERLAMGQLYGAGQSVGVKEPLSFKIKNLDPEGNFTALNACERYETNGAPKPSVPKAWSRTGLIGFRIADNYLPLSTGYIFDSQGNNLGTAGFIPSGIAVSPASQALPALFISYATSNTLLSIIPYDTALISDRSRYRLLR